MCSGCREMIDDSFDACWKCGTTAEGVTPAPVVEASGPPALSCLRCQETIEHLGTKSFHEGTNWGMLGELGELFIRRERFDVYACPRCGKLEFFVDGVGEDHRPG
jgi:hypothetical protein